MSIFHSVIHSIKEATEWVRLSLETKEVSEKALEIHEDGGQHTESSTAEPSVLNTSQEQAQVGPIRKAFNSFLDTLSSPGVGTALVIASSLLSLASPLGIVWGATLCATSLITQVITMGRAASRMRTIHDTQQKELMLDEIIKVQGQNIESNLEPNQKEKLSTAVQDRIKEVLNGKKVDDISDKKRWYNKASGAVRYLSLNSVKNWVISIASLNPVSIAISSLSMLVSNGGAYYGEVKYREDKDQLDKDVLAKQSDILKQLEITGDYKLDKGDIAKILAIKKMEQDIKKSGRYDDSLSELHFGIQSIEEFERTKKASQSNSFVWDFGSLFFKSFSSEGYKEYFQPLDHRKPIESHVTDISATPRHTVIENATNKHIVEENKPTTSDVPDISATPRHTVIENATNKHIVGENKPILGHYTGSLLDHQSHDNKQHGNQK